MKPLAITSVTLLLITLAFMAVDSRSNRGTPTNTTVSITNFAKNSGGTGTIVYNSPTDSRVLTNAHVCGVVEAGGLVNDDEGESYFVTSYKKSLQHDLCLIAVTSDLKHSTKIAQSPPALYEEEQTVGHPHLLPTIITKGNFSHKMVIQVMTGTRACTADELADPMLGFICRLVGQLPIVKSYESVVVSSLIQPGSSGSGIRNANNEVTAVVFAGAGDLGFGFAVPYEYVYNFLNHELASLPSVTVGDNGFPVRAAGSSTAKEREVLEKLIRACSYKWKLSPKEKNICSSFRAAILNQDMIQRF